MSKKTYTLPELKGMIGQEVGVSRWFAIEQDRINTFADVTEDHQYIHIDPEAAKKTPFGGTIAHGFLSLSMLSAMAYDAQPSVENTVMGVNYGFDKIRFLSPVKAGAKIRGRFTLMEVKDRGTHEFMTRNAVTVEIEGSDKPALSAEWLGISYLGK